MSPSDGAMSDSIKAFGARAAMFPVSALAALTLLHILISRFGTSGYAIISLVVAIPALLPMSDLGVGAAVITAGSAADSSGLLKTLVSAVRISLTGTAVITAAAIVLGSLGLWAKVLGIPESGNVGATIALIIFACTLPTGVGQRLLLAKRKNHVNALVQGLAPVVSLGMTVVALAFFRDVTWAIVAVMLGPLVAGIAALVLGFRVSGVGLGQLLRLALLTRERGARIRATATSMFVITLSLPVAYQTDRVILAHVSSLRQVALYSSAMQLFAPCLALVSTAGQTLWPSFVRATQHGRQLAELRRFTVLFGVGGLVGLFGLVGLGPSVAAFVTGGRLHPSLYLMGSFGVLLLAQAIQFPAGMYLTNGRSLRLQAWACAVMALVNVGLSIVFSKIMGAPGPVVASVIAILLTLYPACAWAITQVRKYGPSEYAGTEQVE